MREQSLENITEQYSAPSVHSVTSAIVTKLWFETLLKRWTHYAMGTSRAQKYVTVGVRAVLSEIVRISKVKKKIFYGDLYRITGFSVLGRVYPRVSPA